MCNVDAGSPLGACGSTPHDAGLTGANIGGLLFDPRAPGVAYAATHNEIRQSLDSGASWQRQGSLDGSKQLLPLGSDPNELLATSFDGIAYTSDAGRTWSQVALGGLIVASLAAAPSQPLRMYAGSNIGALFRSDDGGNSWSEAMYGYPYGQTVSIAVDPTDPDTLVSAVLLVGPAGGFIEDGAVMRSTDAGASWSTVLAGHAAVSGLARCPSDPNVLIAATGNGVAKSSDRGLTWNILPVVTGGARLNGVAFSPSDCDDFYALHAGVGVRHTTDGGNSFGPPLDHGIEALPVGSYPDLLAVDPNDRDKLLLGTHDGLYTGAHAGANWSLAPGILDMVIDSLAASPAFPDQSWLASWGSGVWTRASSTANWERIPLQDLPVDYATLVAVSAYAPGMTFVGTGGPLYVSHDGTDFTMQPAIANAVSAAFDPSDPRVAYVVAQIKGVFKTSDGGASWTQITGALTPWSTANGVFMDVRRIAIDPSDPQRLYIATNGRGVLRSDDGGASWNDVFAPSASVMCMVLTAPGTLYACSNGVQMTDDGGATWRDVTAGLPSLGVGDLVYDEPSGQLFALTGQGVFVKRANQSWAELPDVCIAGARTGTIVDEGGQRRLLVAAGERVYGFPL